MMYDYFFILKACWFYLSVAEWYAKVFITRAIGLLQSDNLFSYHVHWQWQRVNHRHVYGVNVRNQWWFVNLISFTLYSTNTTTSKFVTTIYLNI